MNLITVNKNNWNVIKDEKLIKDSKFQELYFNYLYKSWANSLLFFCIITFCSRKFGYCLLLMKCNILIFSQISIYIRDRIRESTYLIVNFIYVPQSSKSLWSQNPMLVYRKTLKRDDSWPNIIISVGLCPKGKRGTGVSIGLHPEGWNSDFSSRGCSTMPQ